MEKTKITKNVLKEMIREELENTLNENTLTDPNFIAGVITLLGMGGAIAASLARDLKNAKTPEEKKEVLKSIANSIEKTKGA